MKFFLKIQLPDLFSEMIKNKEIEKMETQIFGFNNLVMVDPQCMHTVIARSEELKEEALRLQKEKERKDISLKIFDWLKKTPPSQIGIITGWANHNLASSAIRLNIIRVKKSNNFVIKIAKTIGNTTYKVGQSWHALTLPEQLKGKIKRALKEKVARNKSPDASLVLTEIKLAQ